MDVSALLLEIYGRIPPLARHAVVGVDPDRLIERPSPVANSIAWLIWHLARVQDSHIAELLEADQVWVDDGWAGRFGLEPDPWNTGYGHSAAELGTVRPDSPESLLAYLDVVSGRTDELLKGLEPADLDRWWTGVGTRR